MNPVMRRAWQLLAPVLAGMLLGGGLHAQGVSPRQLVEVSDLGELAVSPDGSHVAFRLQRASVERNTHDTAWYVQRMDASAPARRVGEGGQLLRESDGASLAPAGVAWSPDGRFIYYRALLDGRVAVWRARRCATASAPPASRCATPSRPSTTVASTSTRPYRWASHCSARGISTGAAPRSACSAAT